MGDLISRPALLERFNPDEPRIDPIEARYRIVTSPTIDPVVHAYWKAAFAGKAVCSNCDEDQEVEMFIGNPTQKWCARCGARMDAPDA